MPTRTEAIAAFLQAKTHADLSIRYNISMECQVLVAQDNGERVEGEFNGKKWFAYSDGMQQWKSFRIPYNASTIPEYDDKEIRFDLGLHCEAIGMTGWDWRNKCSKWVAYDFDAITGHSEKHTHKLDAQALKNVQDAAYSLPWITIRHSTSGKGLHLYVFLDDVPTQNHTEHAALARSILSKMSGLTGFDFSKSVDICGSNMWIWHRKMTGTNGLSLIKQGDTLLDIPDNWRDHVHVSSGRKTRVTTPLNEQGLPEIEQKFNDLTAQRNRVKLDDIHLGLIKYLTENSLFHWWDADHHMLITHTEHLKKAHNDLNYKGIFETETKGTTTHNCYSYPMRNGGWSVRRYTPGVKEHPSWLQDGAGWTLCYLNIDPTLRSASLANGGLENTTGAYQFRDCESASKTAIALGANVNIPQAAGKRITYLKYHKDGRLIIEFDHLPHDQPVDYDGWLQQKGKWVRMYSVPKTNPIEMDVDNYDDVVRHLITETFLDTGWSINASGNWVDEPLQHVKLMLKSMGLKVPDIDGITGSAVRKPWILTTKPFVPEYPGDRLWNRYAPQFKYPPLIGDSYNYPTWLKLLKHVGSGLDDCIIVDSWCKANGISSGSDYLKIWIASMFQFPTEPLPYLFFYSEDQVTGKSTFHEALSMLFSPGYQFVEHAVLSQQSFNAELEGTILCVIEETDLSNSKSTAYDRIKNWVTSPKLSIHRKNFTPYLTTNTTHFIQCANNRRNCPIFPGDTRIVMIKVPKLEQEIPKRILMRQLEKEASDFLGGLMSLEIPDSNTRLRLPVVETSEKLTAQHDSMTALQTFIDEKTHYHPGKHISIAEFYDKFNAWLEPVERVNWTKRKISGMLPDRIQKGVIGNVGWVYINLSFLPITEQPMSVFYLSEKNNVLVKRYVPPEKKDETQSST